MCFTTRRFCFWLSPLLAMLMSLHHCWTHYFIMHMQRGWQKSSDIWTVEVCETWFCLWMKPLGYFSKVHSHLAIHLAVRSGPYFFSQHKGDFFIKHGKSKEEVTWGKKRKKKKSERDHRLSCKRWEFSVQEYETANTSSKLGEYLSSRHIAAQLEYNWFWKYHWHWKQKAKSPSS